MRGEDRAVLLEARLAVVRAEQRERAAADPHRGGVGVRAAVLDDAEARVLVAAEGDLEQLELGELGGPGLGGAARAGVEVAVREAHEVAELRALRAEPRGAGEAAEQEPRGQRRPLLERLPPQRDEHDASGRADDHGRRGAARRRRRCAARRARRTPARASPQSCGRRSPSSSPPPGCGAKRYVVSVTASCASRAAAAGCAAPPGVGAELGRDRGDRPIAGPDGIDRSTPAGARPPPRPPPDAAPTAPGAGSPPGWPVAPGARPPGPGGCAPAAGARALAAGAAVLARAGRPGPGGMWRARLRARAAVSRRGALPTVGCPPRPVGVLRGACHGGGGATLGRLQPGRRGDGAASDRPAASCATASGSATRARGRACRRGTPGRRAPAACRSRRLPQSHRRARHHHHHRPGRHRLRCSRRRLVLLPLAR